MKEDWEEADFTDCLEHFKVSAKVPKKQYLSKGSYPIVSQEAELISGFWDAEEDLNRITRPLVVFGDHTQVVKFIDFDFVVGADGVKVLYSKDFLYPKYFYYYILAHPIPSLGYARHFRHLKSIKVRYPPLDEQKRIVSILELAFEGLDRARANAEANLESAKELFDSFAANIFSTQTDRWANCTIGEVITLQRGIDITKKDQRKGPVPVVSSGGIKSYHDTAHARGPGVIVGRKGSIGSVHFVNEDYWPHDTTLWVRDFKGNEPRLVYFLLKGINLAELDTGTANPSLNRNLVHKINISWPSGDLQKEVVKELEDCSTKSDKLKDYYQDKLQDISDLRQSLLQKAFSGELT